MRLHLILGPTGIGKTNQAVQLAKATGAPVVVLDRIQCYQELTTTSGRPLQAELDGTTRVYLDDRQLTDGDFTAAEAYPKLLNITHHLASQHGLIILEGGSLSLCTALLTGGLTVHKMTIENLTILDIAMYRQRVYRRILEMLIPGRHQPSMVEELAHVWQYSEHRTFLETIGGFDVILAWCRRAGVTPLEVSMDTYNPAVRQQLARLILERYLEHAQTQLAVFAQITAQISRDKGSTGFVRHNAKVMLKG